MASTKAPALNILPIKRPHYYWVVITVVAMLHHDAWKCWFRFEPVPSSKKASIFAAGKLIKRVIVALVLKKRWVNIWCSLILLPRGFWQGMPVNDWPLLIVGCYLHFLSPLIKCQNAPQNPLLLTGFTVQSKRLFRQLAGCMIRQASRLFEQVLMLWKWLSYRLSVPWSSC